VNYGFGLSFDQVVENVFDLFGRFGWQRPDLMPLAGGPTVEWSWSGGVQVCGKYWKRNEDHIAVAVGQDFVSKEYKDAGNPGSNEGHIEAYYSWKLNRCLTVSPDLQLIWNPNGVSKAWQGDMEPVWVYSARVQYVF
jgi:carbohydrate-selective porin OprB